MVDVVIVAAGSGTRLGASVPKAFVGLGDKPLFYYSLKLFESSDRIDNIVLVVPEEYIDHSKSLISNYGFKKVRAVVEGGKERNDSVANGFEQLNPNADYVLIHDAARPLLNAAVLNNVIDALGVYKAAFPGIPAVDTVKELDCQSMEVERTLERSKLVCVQTPQGFAADMIPFLLKKASETNVAYDEAMLLEGICPIKVVDGDQENFKITRKADLRYAEFVLKERG